MQAKKFLQKLLNIFYLLSITLATLLVFSSVIGVIIGEPSFWQGLLALRSMFSPFNLSTYLIIFILYLPSLIFYKLKQLLEKQIKETSAKFKTKSWADDLVRNLNYWSTHQDEYYSKFEKTVNRPDILNRNKNEYKSDTTSP